MITILLNRTSPPGISIPEMLLFAIYVLMGSFLLWHLWSGKNRATRLIPILALAIFFQHCTMGLLHHATAVLPHMPDTLNYKAWIFEHESPVGMTPSVKFMYHLGYLIAPLCLYKPVLLSVIHALLLQCSIWLIWRTWTRNAHIEKPIQAGNSGVLVLFLTFVFFWPAAALYIPALLREAWVLVAFALFICGFVEWKHHSNGRTLIMLMSGLILLGLLRTLLVLPAVALFTFGLLQKWRVKWQVKAGVTIFASIAVAILISQWLNLNIDPVSLGVRRNLSVQNPAYAGVTYGYAEWNNWFHVVMAQPGLILQLLFAPLPILGDAFHFDKKFASADAIYCLLVSGLFFGSLFDREKKRILLLSTVLIFTIMIAFYEYHLIGAVRHRMPVILLMLPAAAGWLHPRLVKITRFAHR